MNMTAVGIAPTIDCTAPEFTVSRVFEAPRFLVWAAWTQSERLARWWGPAGFTVRVPRLDLRPGGTLLYGMRSPDGNDTWGKWVYREVLAPERLVFLGSFCDEEGNTIRHPMCDSWPLQLLCVLTFTAHGRGTSVTLSGRPYDAGEDEVRTFEAGRESMNMGFDATFDQLDAYLKEARR